MQLGDSVDQTEAESVAKCRAALLTPVETVREMRQVDGRDTGSIILDR
jgi:hypothetical protein